jgi:hypothetical protein
MSSVLCGELTPFIDHIEPKGRRPDLRHDPANGVTLCRRHHEFFHDHPKQFAAFVADYLPRP